jgi:endo-1,4-beta-xylanase
MPAALPHKLHELAPFPIGTVIKWPEVSLTGPYASLASRQFNSFTPESTFKASELRPTGDEFRWENADRLIEFCISNNKRVHGHTLLWDRALPDWIQNVDARNDKVLEEHVRQVTNRYSGKITGWDVVNEAFDEEGGLKKGVWNRIGGDNYISRAFTIASVQDPQARLFYNDFDLEANETKRNGVLKYLNSLRDSGVPIHGIGLQLHLNISSANVSSIERTFLQFAEAGYLIHISELDLSVNPYHGVISGKEELFQAQAKLLWLVFEKYLQVPPALRYGVTFWGVGDADSWLTSDLKQVDYPLLFDEEYEPKPAWYTLVEMFTRQNGH